MKLISKIMYIILCLTIYSLIAVNAQENSYNPEVMSSIRECYNNSYLLTRDNRLPHNMITLIEILRKIEDSPALTMRPITSLSKALLHGFRQDGIQRLETTFASNLIIPYSSKTYKFNRYVKLLRAISGDARTFPNNSISDIERCTLHFMLSDAIEYEKREDENCNRNYDNAYRFPRSVDEKSLKIKEESAKDDAEMLSPQEIQSMTNNKQEGDSDVDPNSFYPEFPPNHPAVAQYVKEPSSCPVLNGVIKTKWGEVSGGPLIAAIAAAMQPQLININELMVGESVEPGYFENSPQINNKWFATLSGELATVCWRQGPIFLEKNTPFVIGTDGKWNSSQLPRWFFLDSNKNLELPKPLLRGDIDGLIIAHEIQSWKQNGDFLQNNIRLSQVLDMFYSPRGLINSQTRACYRKELFSQLVPNTETLEQQTYSAMKIMKDLAKTTMDDTLFWSFSKKAARQITNDVASLMKDDLSCAETDRHNDFSRPFVDLTIILDTSWPLKNIQPILSKLFEGIEVSKFNSNFTLVSGQDGMIIINSSNTILDLYSLNTSSYEKFKKGFNMCQTIEIVERMLKEKLDREHSQQKGGGNMDVILFVPYSSSSDDRVKECVTGIMKNMDLMIPDASVLFLTPPGLKQMAANYVKLEDIFTIATSPSSSTLYPIDSLISRLKEFPKRLINSQCGSNYNAQGSWQKFPDSVEPRGTNFYRIHPNYFYNSESTPKVTIEGSSDAGLTICDSRQLIHSNSSKFDESRCQTINANSKHTIELYCGDADVIHHCQPYYISVKANNSSTSSYGCRDCRFLDEIRYSISYDNLVCRSVASSITKLPVFIILSVISLFKFINL